MVEKEANLCKIMTGLTYTCADIVVREVKRSDSRQQQMAEESRR